MSDHFIVVGGNALAHRLAVELTMQYDAEATAIVATALATGDIMANTVRSTVITTLGNTDEIVSARTADTSSLATVGQATGTRYLTPSETSAIVTAAKRLQSRRLDTYVAYMFIALVAVTAPTIDMA